MDMNPIQGLHLEFSNVYPIIDGANKKIGVKESDALGKTADFVLVLPPRKEPRLICRTHPHTTAQKQKCFSKKTEEQATSWVGVL